MQLLNPQQVEHKRLASEDADLTRLAALRKYIEQEETKLKLQKDKYEQENRQLSEDLAKLTALHMESIASQKKEIEILEVRKAEALQSIEPLKEQAAKELEDVKRAANANAKKEILLNERENELILSLHASKTKANEMTYREFKVIEVEKHNQAETDRIVKENELLISKQNELSVKRADIEAKLQSKLDEITRRETEIAAQVEQIKRDRDKLSKESIHIASQQASLKLAYEEVRNK